MDGILSESASSRRKFLDRICASFFPKHANHIALYEYYLKSSLKILTNQDFRVQYNKYSDWLFFIEKNLAELSVIIKNTRDAALNLLRQNKCTSFISPIISIVECSEMQNLEEKEDIAQLFYDFRLHDSEKRRSNIGVHKVDIEIQDPTAFRNLKLCSTSEKKSMLISLVLSQSNTLKDHFGFRSILLLDDIFSHLDTQKQNILTEELEKLDIQTWITGPNIKSTFSNFKRIDL